MIKNLGKGSKKSANMRYLVPKFISLYKKIVEEFFSMHKTPSSINTHAHARTYTLTHYSYLGDICLLFLYCMFIELKGEETIK